MLKTNANGPNPDLHTGRESTAKNTSSRKKSTDCTTVTSPDCSTQAVSSSSSSSGVSRFRQLFDASLVERDDVLLLPLCEIFVEISLMMSSWNYVFQVAVIDLQKKVERIRAAVGAQPEKFRSMRSAADHEQAIGQFLKKESTSVTQILFSLHRTMRFTIAFIDGIRRTDASVEISTVARDAYLSTVARHHNWATRKMTTAVMGSVPARREMIESILKQDGNGVGQAEFLDGFLSRAEVLRDRCDSILGKE